MLSLLFPYIFCHTCFSPSKRRTFQLPSFQSKMTHNPKILNQEIESFEMNFMKELSLRDQVMIHENVSDDCIVFSITKEDKNCYALQMNLK